MEERPKTLIELERLLHPTLARRPGARRAPSRAGLSKKPDERAAAQAFDLGAPISLRYGDDHLAPAPRPGAERLARQRSVFVEPFEEVSEPEPASEEELEASEEAEEPEREAEDAAWPPEEEQEEPEIASPGDESEDAGTVVAAAGLSLGKRPVGKTRPVASRAHAEQVAAFEREVQALSERRPQREPTAAPADQPAPADEEPGATPPIRGRGHGVFEEMAQGMEYAREFRLPPVAVQRLFGELDQQIDREATRKDRGTIKAHDARVAAAASAPPIPMPGDDELAQDLSSLAREDTASEAMSRLLASELGTGLLRPFAPEEVLLTEEDARAAFKFFWPDLDPVELGPLAVTDRAFAQALLIEAADASHSVGIVETLYRTFYGKVASDFDAVKEMLKKVAKKAIEDKWFKKIETLKDAEGQQIYESVRATLALNQRPTYESRRQTGELTGY